MACSWIFSTSWSFVSLRFNSFAEQKEIYQTNALGDFVVLERNEKRFCCDIFFSLFSPIFNLSARLLLLAVVLVWFCPVHYAVHSPASLITITFCLLRFYYGNEITQDPFLLNSPWDISEIVYLRVKKRMNSRLGYAQYRRHFCAIEWNLRNFNECPKYETWCWLKYSGFHEVNNRLSRLSGHLLNSVYSN